VKLRARSLRTQLLATIAVVVLCAGAISLAVGAVLTRRAVDRSILQDVAQQADLLAERERVALLPLGHLESLRPFLERQHERAVVAPLDRPSKYLVRDAVDRLRTERRSDGTVTVGGDDWFYAARPVAGRALVLLRPRVSGAAAWRPYLEGLLIAAAIGVALAAVVSLLLARRIARPLRRVAEATERLAAGESPGAVPAEGAAELASLADSFNHMAAELEHARDAERAFLLSVSHELKTPLTSVIGYAEGLADGTVDVGVAAATIGKEAVRLDRLVRDLLDLARMNRHEFGVRNEDVDLGEIAAECVRRHDAQASSYRIDLVLDASDDAWARGDGDRVLQALSNLVENALRVSPAGGAVRVVARPGLLAVEDDGPGLRPDEIPHAFERFFLYSRYAGRRAVGTGLGLAIVDELARAMGGLVEVRSRPGETRFSLRLPVASTRHQLQTVTFGSTSADGDLGVHLHHAPPSAGQEST
jgi:two-component system OmpR family sensor kinase